jgi:hypothetical protein
LFVVDFGKHSQKQRVIRPIEEKSLKNSVAQRY